MADGSIIIKTDIDDKQAQTELNRLTKKSMRSMKRSAIKSSKQFHSWSNQSRLPQISMRLNLSCRK